MYLFLYNLCFVHVTDPASSTMRLWSYRQCYLAISISLFMEWVRVSNLLFYINFSNRTQKVVTRSVTWIASDCIRWLIPSLHGIRGISICQSVLSIHTNIINLKVTLSLCLLVRLSVCYAFKAKPLILILLDMDTLWFLRNYIGYPLPR